jgi:hypothetical protein
VTGLAPGTTYTVCLAVHDKANTEEVVGPAVTFTTVPEPTTDAANTIAARTATLNGYLTLDPIDTQYSFRYKAGTECAGGSATPNGDAGSAAGTPASEATPVTELLPNTTYAVCFVTSSQFGSQQGAPVSFTTLPEAYAVKTTSTSVTLKTDLNPETGATSYKFSYEPAAGTASGLEGTVEGGPVTVEAHLQDLTPNHTYHFQVTATRDGETLPSEDRTFTTQAAATAFTLPDGRQYEMVTPPEKEGALFYDLYEGRVVQASVNGNAIADEANRPTEAEPKGYDEQLSVLSTRGPGGWSSQDVEGEHNAVGELALSEGPESRDFSKDLSHMVVQQLGQFTPLSPEASEPTPYLRTNYFNGNVSEHCEGSYLTTSSCFQPLVTRANTIAGAVFGEVLNGVCPRFFCGLHFVVGTPDLSHVILHHGIGGVVQLTASVPPGFEGEYEWSGGQLQPLPGNVPNQESSPFNNPIGLSHAISVDGGRVVVEHEGVPGGLGGLYLFDAAKGETVRLDVPEPGCGACSGGVDGFQTANSEDSRIFFIDDGPLTAEHSGEADLYECEIVEVAGKLKCNLSNLTPSAAGASMVLGASEDGSYVYFAAGGGLAPGSIQGACTPGNETGNVITEGCDLYVRHDGVTRLVAPSWIEGGTRAAESSRVSPDGRWLAFVSRKSLTGYDNRDAVSGQPDTEVYLYHAETSSSGALEGGKLVCASCDPSGARPVGADVEFDEEKLAGWVAAATPQREGLGGREGENRVYQSRYLSDSGRLFFNSYDALVPQDVNGVEDVYEYDPEGVPAGEHACSSSSTSGSEVFEPARAFEVEGVRGEEGAGCVALISSGTSSERSSFLDASGSGGDLFFLTTSKLDPQDFDTAYDVYDAHECTMQSPCSTSVVVPPPCTTEASCKLPPTPQPSIYGLPSSATFSGPGNLAPPPPAVVKKVTKKTVKCKKGDVKNKQGKCVKNKKKTKARKASDHRRSK